MPDFAIRPATPADAPVILELLRELATGQLPAGEPLSARFWLTEEDVRRDMMGAACHCALAFAGAVPVGLVSWYGTYNSFRVARGLFVEDLYVQPAFRGRGLGKALLAWLAARARDMNGFLEWQVLERNPAAIRFYQGLGAAQVPEWLNYRLEGEALTRLAQ